MTLGHHSNIIENDKDGRASGGSENEIEFGRRNTGVGSGAIGTQSSSFRDVSASSASLQQHASRINVARAAAASTGRSHHRPPLASQDRNSAGAKPPRSVETTRSRNSSFGSGKSPTKLGHYSSPYGQGNRRLTPRQRSRSLTPSGRRANDTTVASSILNSSSSSSSSSFRLHGPRMPQDKYELVPQDRSSSPLRKRGFANSRDHIPPMVSTTPAYSFGTAPARKKSTLCRNGQIQSTDPPSPAEFDAAVGAAEAAVAAALAEGASGADPASSRPSIKENVRTAVNRRSGLGGATTRRKISKRKTRVIKSGNGTARHGQMGMGETAMRKRTKGTSSSNARTVALR